MDTVFISKVAIITALFVLTTYVYKKTDWHVPGLRNWEGTTGQKLNNFLNRTFKKPLDDFLILFYVIFWGLPMFGAVVLLGYFILFEGTLKFLISRTYWEQILIVFGGITLCFAIRIYLDGKKLREKQKDDLIDEQKKLIAELKKKLNDMRK